MPIIEWNENYSLGIDPFDDHHHHLIDLLNTTYDDITAGEPEAHLASVLDELIDYACYHFAAEENWMKENGYPQAAEHVQMHDRFSLKIVSMDNEYSAGSHHLSLELVTFMKEWLLNHILKADADYAVFIAQKNAGQGIALEL